MASKIRRVAVIGAGPSGAIATDALVKEQVFDVVRVYDRNPETGGQWVHAPHLPPGIPSLSDLIAGHIDAPVPIPEHLLAITPLSEQVNDHQHRFFDTAVHEHLHSNIVASFMGYTQEPIPPIRSARTVAEYGPGSPYRQRDVIRDYVEGIFHRGGHRKLVQLGTTVERAEKVGGVWVLTLRKSDGERRRNEWWEERFDAVVVASGHYNVPWVPEIEGLVEWEREKRGRVVHSKHFRGAERYKDKRVIVVGGSVSAHEVIHEILDVAKKPIISSMRSGPVPSFGWEPFLHPNIEIRKQIVRFEVDTGRIRFEDGSFVDDVDHVIFGTGYTVSFPFLPRVQERVRGAYRRLPGVWEHVWDIEDPTLAFIGMVGGGATFRVFEWQAVAVARRLAGRIAKPLPSEAEQREWERRRVAERKGGKVYHSVFLEMETYFETLRGIAGDPAPGTTGRVLPPFDRGWLEVWKGMVAVKVGYWRRKRDVAEKSAGQEKAKL